METRVAAIFDMQTEFFATLERINRDGFDRAKSELRLVSELSGKLTAARYYAGEHSYAITGRPLWRLISAWFPPELRALVCLSRCGPWTASVAVVCGNPESDRGVAGSTDHRGIPVKDGADLFGVRQ
jgi:hypothetical protein